MSNSVAALVAMAGATGLERGAGQVSADDCAALLAEPDCHVARASWM